MFERDFSEAGLWTAVAAAVAFFGYLLVDSLRHRLKWRRLLKKSQECQNSD